MGKTITAYLIDGNPKGTQYLFISNKNCKMYVIPRSNISILNDPEREELRKPAFYILLGEDEETTKPKAYIGETENFSNRVKDHDNKKTFWQKALVFISKDGDMTKADVQYLEHRAIKEAKNSNTFILNENNQVPKAPNLPEYRKDTMETFFEDVKFLSSYIGCNIFDMVIHKEKHLFYLRGRDFDAKGFYDTNGFTVLKGSIIAKSSVPSCRWKEKRDKLLQDYTSLNKNNLELQSDKSFQSPSTAAEFCNGRNNNGWLVWKDENGKTLDAVYRKQLE